MDLDAEGEDEVGGVVIFYGLSESFEGVFGGSRVDMKSMVIISLTRGK